MLNSGYTSSMPTTAKRVKSKHRDRRTEEEIRRCNEVLAEFGVSDAALESPRRPNRESLTVLLHPDVRAEFAVYAERLGFRSPGVLARFLVNWFTVSRERPPELKTPRAKLGRFRSDPRTGKGTRKAAPGASEKPPE